MNFKHNKPMPHEYYAIEDTNIPYENPNYSIIRLRVEKKTHVFLSLNQMDERKFRGRAQGDQPYTFSIARMLLAKVEPFGLRFIDGVFYNDRNIVIEQNLNAGIYVITIEIMWEQQFYREFNLSNSKPLVFFINKIGIIRCIYSVSCRLRGDFKGRY